MKGRSAVLQGIARCLVVCLALVALCHPAVPWAQEVEAPPQPPTAAPATEPATGTETVESGTETEAERSKVYMKLGTVTVTEKSQYVATADIPASVDVIGADQIETENVDFSMELMKKVPGTYFGDWNQGVISGTFSLRGFDTNHDVPATLIVDGIPHLFGYGRMDIQPFFPLEIDRLELVKGTSDPRYGLQNIAGNLNLYTKRGGNQTQARLLTGSFDTYDGSIITSHETGRFTQTYFAGYRQSEGYREHSDLKKGAASGKWFYTSEDERFSIGAIARYFGMDADAPGYLSKEQSDEHPSMAAPFARTDGGEQENKHLSLHMDYGFSDQLKWSVKAYGQELERTRWARWSMAGSQSETLQDDKQYGAISNLTFETEDWGIRKLKLEWGLDFQHQDNLQTRWNTKDRVRQGDPFRDWDFSQQYVGSYIQADGEILSWLRLIGGLRVDNFGGELHNCISDTKSDMLDMDLIWQPKIGAIITPIQGYSLFANYGRTFQLPGTPQLFGQDAAGHLISRDLAESANDGWEVGVKVSPVQWLSARVSYWDMVATDEVRDKKDGTGDFINAGETHRKGWDFSASIRPYKMVSLWGSFSWVDAIYTDPGPGLEAQKGKHIENIPEYIGKVGADFEHPCGFFSSLWLEAQSDYYIDPQNLKEKDGAYDIWNLKLGYTASFATFNFEVKNLFDQKYNGFIWNDFYGYSPGDERSFYGSVTFKF
jgi:iron complex outermembrane recepter protein